MSEWAIPPDVEAVFRHLRTCEFTTLARDGTPITWPTLPFWQPHHGRFLITTSIGLPQKAFNVRREPRVALYFSESIASGLVNPPTVLVQGDATSPEAVRVDVSAFSDELRQTLDRQPAGRFYSSNPITRWLFDWYYMRLEISVVPRRILWWPGGDLTRPAQTWEVPHVG